jgi:hypothetical protein
MIGKFSISHGFCGLISAVAFKLLVLATESNIQIAQVNSVSLERLDIIRLINKCCGIVEGEGKNQKTSLIDRVMKAASVLLDAAVFTCHQGQATEVDHIRQPQHLVQKSEGVPRGEGIRLEGGGGEGGQDRYR